MNQILYCDWLSKGSRWCYLARTNKRTKERSSEQTYFEPTKELTDFFLLTGENMGFKLFRERMGDELYLKKMKEADEVIKTYIFASFTDRCNTSCGLRAPLERADELPRGPLGGTDEL